VTNNAAIVVDTNVFCTLYIKQFSDGNFDPPPICIVGLTNSTRSRVWSASLPASMLFAVDLVDTNGHFIEKTEYGKGFGLPLTQKQVNERFLPKRIAHGSMAAGYLAQAGLTPTVGEFSIPKAFNLKQPGEYTLYIRLRLIQSCVSDSSGTIRTNIFDAQYFGSNRTNATVFQSIWLPEISTNLQIHSGNIQTNK
jgi:hypothetical protein